MFKSGVYSLGFKFLYLASLESIRELSGLENLQNRINQRINQLPAAYNHLKEILQQMLFVDE